MYRVPENEHGVRAALGMLAQPGLPNRLAEERENIADALRMEALQRERVAARPVHAEPERPVRASRSAGAIAAAVQARQQAEQATAQRKLEQKLTPYSGLCWWCFTPGFPHDPDKAGCCTEKITPDLSAFQAPRVCVRCVKGGTGTKLRGHRQTKEVCACMRALPLSTPFACPLPLHA